MRIIVNAANTKKGGPVQVAISFIKELKCFPENEYIVFVNKSLISNIDINTFGNNFIFYIFDWDFITIKDIYKRAKKLSRLENEINPDCVVSTGGPSYWHTKSPYIMGYALGLFLYPESPYFKSFSLKKKIRHNLKKIVQNMYYCRDADVIITQTDDVNERVRRILGKDKVYTVTNNCSSFFLSFSDYKPIIGMERKNKIRLLTVSAYYFHKNLEIIPSVIKALSSKEVDNIEFVLTLSDEDYKRIIPKEYRNQVRNVGFVEPKDVPSLYSECDIMFLPTLAECFSASYPEAMVMGLPIITTNLGFAHSICGEAALFFEPMNGADAAAKIEMLISNPDLWKSLVEKGKRELEKFDTPQQRAQKILDICKTTIECKK